MIELGSYWAYYSIWFAKAVPGSRLILVEPDPNHLAVGTQNFALNGVAGEFHTASVGRASRPPQPFLCKSDLLHRLVPEVCVDDLMRRSRLDRVDLLLIDIQGPELDALEGAAAGIREGRLRFVLLSTHHHSISGDPLTHQKCLDFVRRQGGHVLAEHNVTESYSGDGLIVASFDPADRNLPPIPISRNCPTNSLFRELEYDVDEAWQAIVAVEGIVRSFGDRDPRLAAALEDARAQHGVLGRRWPAFAAKAA